MREGMEENLCQRMFNDSNLGLILEWIGRGNFHPVLLDG